MFKLMIVEDEPGITRLIDSSIEYEALGLRLVATAENGAGGLAQALELEPDIVITDISMPEMDGLEFIEQVQARGLKTRFVIISGHAQFDYARGALKLGVEDFLLKPISKEELNEALERILVNLQSDFAPESSFARFRLQKRKLRASFIMNLLYNRGGEAEALQPEHINREYQYAFGPGLYQFGLLQVDFPADTVLGMKNYVSEQMGRLLQNNLQHCVIEMESCVQHEQLLFLLNYSADGQGAVDEALQATLVDVEALLASYGDAAVTLCAGLAQPGPAGLPASISSAFDALKARVLLGHGRIIHAAGLPRCAGGEEPDPHVKSLLGQLQELAGLQNYAGMEQLLPLIFEQMIEAAAACPQGVYDRAKPLVFQILTILHQQGVFAEDITPHYVRLCDSIDGFSAARQFTGELPGEIIGLINSQRDDQQLEDSKTIQIAKKYMEDNYNKNLRLEDVAEQVYLAPAYFGILFKKELGQNFSTYLTGLRMEKAKEMLRDVRLNISEIAYGVGYSNKRYFSRVFKENVGITPNEYRKLHAKTQV